jgi:hypothetical protein
MIKLNVIVYYACISNVSLVLANKFSVSVKKVVTFINVVVSILVLANKFSGSVIKVVTYINVVVSIRKL